MYKIIIRFYRYHTLYFIIIFKQLPIFYLDIQLRQKYFVTSKCTTTRLEINFMNMLFAGVKICQYS